MSNETEEQSGPSLSKIFSQDRVRPEAGGHFRMDPEEPVAGERYAKEAKSGPVGLKEEFEEKRQSASRSASAMVFDFYHGLTPGDGFINMRAQGKRTGPGGYGPRQMTEAQMIRLIRIAVEREGWTNIWFHKNGVIDQAATNLANQLLTTKLAPYREKMAAQGRDFQVRSFLPEHVLAGTSLSGQLLHTHRFKVQNRELERAGKRNAKLEKRAGRGMNAPPP